MNELNWGAVSHKREDKSMLTEQVSSFSRSTNPVIDESPADISSNTIVATLTAHCAESVSGSLGKP